MENDGSNGNNNNSETIQKPTQHGWLYYTLSICILKVIQQQLMICLLLCLTIKMPSHRAPHIASNQIHFDKAKKKIRQTIHLITLKSIK